MTKLTTENLLFAYANGFFPMAERKDSLETFWVLPDTRSFVLLEQFHIPKSLKKFIKHCNWHITINHCFLEIIEACQAAKRNETETWINDAIIAAYHELYLKDHALSVEVWEKGTLIGGLYGVKINRAFFGESMFSHTSNASKVALVHLVHYLKDHNFTLLDAQFPNPHLLPFGFQETSQDVYMKHLKEALQ